MKFKMCSSPSPLPTQSIKIRFERDVLVAASMGAQMAQQAGFSRSDCARIETVILELARNQIAHAGEGTIELAWVRARQREGLSIRAVDRGQGIENVILALQDGFTTKGTLGIGLGVVLRMMDDFSIRSHPGWGTQIVAIKWKQ